MTRDDCSEQPHSEQPLEAGVILDAEFVDLGPADASEVDFQPAGMALVPMVEPARWSYARPLPRPDSIFLTHLIATREQAPQTCTLRRASASDANAAYTANRLRVSGAGLRARQTV
jgi:hypothetical protein